MVPKIHQIVLKKPLVDMDGQPMFRNVNIDEEEEEEEVKQEEEEEIEEAELPPELEEKPKTAYEIKGIEVIVHYLKQFVP